MTRMFVMGVSVWSAPAAAVRLECILSEEEMLSVIIQWFLQQTENVLN